MNIKDVVEFVDRKGNNSMIVEWKLTKFCNYNCPFCSNKLMNAREDTFLPQSQVEALAEKIKLLLLRSKVPVEMKFIGGEPTIYEILSLIRIIHNPYIESYMLTTNLFRPAFYYKEIKEYCSKLQVPFKLYASYHEEAVGYEDFFNKIREIGYDKFTTVGVVVNNKNIDLCINLIKNVTDVPIKFRIEYDKMKTPVKLEDPEKEKIILEYLSQFKNAQNVKFITRDGQLHKYSYSQLQSEFGSIVMHDFECESHTVQIRPEGIVRTGLCNYLAPNVLGDLWKDNEFTIAPSVHRCKAEMYCNSFPINAKRVEN